MVVVVSDPPAGLLLAGCGDARARPRARARGRGGAA
jgi:hypothetical protein